MPAPTNTVTSTEMNIALDAELVERFTHDYTRFAEILGIFAPEVMTAGTALNQIKITGTLNNSKTDPSVDAEEGTVVLGESSGSAYVEGDLVALSKYQGEKVAVGEIKLQPYRRMTTAQAIARSGYVQAVLNTDRKMLVDVQNQIMTSFFTFLGKGTGSATGTTLQKALAKVDAELGDTLEDNNDATGAIVHFLNRQDVADYLGDAEITLQNAFGMTYLQNFLGVTNVFLTNKVTSGTMYATPVENIHVYGTDFAALGSAGITYQTDGTGLIGVAHTPRYDHVSAETNILCGALFFPEVKDYIVKGTIAPTA